MPQIVRNYKKTSESITYAPKINVDPKAGLTHDQVEQRKKLKLTNKTKKHVSKSYGRIVFDNVFNALNIILFIVFGLMVAAKLPFSRYFFMIILIANIVLGLIQDIHSRRLTDRLRVLTDPTATVVRNGVETNIAVGDVVLSDILLLSQGDQIPADCVIVEGSCSIDESLLSGESIPVKKEEGDWLLSGSFINKGNVKAEVGRVGSANYAEQLQAKASKFERPKSEIRRSTNVIMRVCAVACVVLGLVQFLAWAIKETVRGREFLEVVTNMDGGLGATIDKVSASMVAMIPAGMVLLTTAALASGVVVLAKRKMLVQQLFCIEMLARVDVLCLDKTGTLTDGTMKVVKLITVGSSKEEDAVDAMQAILRFTHDSNSTANAIKAEYGSEHEGTPKEVLPFDSENKVSAVCFEGEGTVAMGAYGYIKAKPSEALKNKIDDYASRGYRCLVVCKSKKMIVNGVMPDGFEYLALLILSDHIKGDAKTNIAWFQNNGVDVRIISGDDPVTVSEIAKACGVLNADQFISLEGKNPAEVEALADKYKVFGRASPEQKAILITAFKKAGHKVAMTGDGVNDILALKVADCSIAMASGSDAARNVSHLVSLESSFSSLPDVVGQGRRIITNLQRTCSLFLNKTFFAVITTLIFLISGLSGGHIYPFSTSNLIVWEVFSIGTAAFFLALQPSKERLIGSFGVNTAMVALPSAVCNAIGSLLPFFIYLVSPSALASSGDPETAFMAATSLSILVFTTNSFIVLFGICLPMDRYRAIVFSIMLLLGVGVIMADFFWRRPDGFGQLLSIPWGWLTVPLVPWLFLCVAISTGLYVLMRLAVKKLKSTSEKGGLL